MSLLEIFILHLKLLFYFFCINLSLSCSVNILLLLRVIWNKKYYNDYIVKKDDHAQSSVWFNTKYVYFSCLRVVSMFNSSTSSLFAWWTLALLLCVQKSRSTGVWISVNTFIGCEQPSCWIFQYVSYSTQCTIELQYPLSYYESISSTKKWSVFFKGGNMQLG